MPEAFTEETEVSKPLVPFNGDPSDIPSGWIIADGNNGTPDMKDRFLRGLKNPDSENPGGKYGQDSTTMSESDMPEHNHDGNTDAAGSHSHTLFYDADQGHLHEGGSTGQAGGGDARRTFNAGSHVHTLSLASVGSGSSIDIRPSFYKITFIMPA